MKFARRFEEDLQDVGWEHNYFRYKDLKRVVHLLTLVYPSERATDRTQDLIYADLEGTKVTTELVDNKRPFAAFPNPLTKRKGKKEMEKKHIDRAQCLSAAEALLDSFIETRGESPDSGPSTSCEENIDVPSISQLEARKDAVLKKFEEAMSIEVDRIDAFAKEVMSEVNKMRKFSDKEVGKLLDKENLAQHISMEYIFRLSDEEMKTLGQFGNTITESQSLSTFIFVNVAAVKRMHQKFEQLVDQGKEKYSVAKIVIKLERRIEAINHVRAELEQEMGEIMCSSSSYYEYLQDHMKQLETLRFRTKLTRYEDEIAPSRLKNFTRLLDLDSRLKPTQFLSTSVWLVFLTLFMTYLISYIDKNNNVSFVEKGYFISASIDHAPASNIGTLGLNISLCFIGIIIFIKHKIVKKQLRGRVWMKTHRISCALGLVSVVSGMGVAAFQHHHVPSMHNVFAVGFFVGGFIHTAMETVIEIRHRLSSRFGMRIRTALVLVMAMAVVFFLCPMGFLLYKKSHGGLPLKTRVRIRMVASFNELVAFFCLVSWFATYYSTFAMYRFQLHVHRKQI